MTPKDSSFIAWYVEGLRDGDEAGYEAGDEDEDGDVFI